MRTEMLDISLLVIGFIILIIAIFFGKALGKRPVELKMDKLGGFFLKGDVLSLILLIGVALMSVGIFLRVKNYQSQVKSLDEQVKEKEKLRLTVSDELQKFKEYQLNLVLVFDSEINPTKLKYSLVKQIGNNVPEEVGVSPKFADGQTWITLDHIRLGEKIKIVATKDDTTKWACEQIEIPHSRVLLKKQPI